MKAAYNQVINPKNMGKIKNKKRYHYDSEGKYLIQTSQFLDGKRHGLTIFYYKSGNKLGELEFKNGLKHGKSIEWNEDGNKRIEMFFENNQVHGEYKSWWENGKLKEHGFFNRGKKIGEYRWYKKDGSLWSEHDYGE